MADEAKIGDEELVRRTVAEKDAQAFAGIYDRYAQRVYHKCLNFSKSVEEAQDMVQDIFVRLYLKLRTFKGQSRFSTWLYAFAYNHCVNYVQRQLKKRGEKIVLSENIEEMSEEVEVPDNEIMHMKSDKLMRALQEIDPGDKAVILMKYQDDFSIEEIQEALEIGKSAVKMRLSRAKQRLLETYNNL